MFEDGSRSAPAPVDDTLRVVAAPEESLPSGHAREAEYMLLATPEREGARAAYTFDEAQRRRQLCGEADDEPVAKLLRAAAARRSPADESRKSEAPPRPKYRYTVRMRTALSCAAGRRRALPSRTTTHGVRHRRRRLDDEDEACAVAAYCYVYRGEGPHPSARERYCATPSRTSDSAAT